MMLMLLVQAPQFGNHCLTFSPIALARLSRTERFWEPNLEQELEGPVLPQLAGPSRCVCDVIYLAEEVKNFS